MRDVVGHAFASGGRRKREMKRGASRVIRCKPQAAAVRGHERAAYRKAHPGSRRFRREERIENARGDFRIHAVAVVDDRYDGAHVAASRADRQHLRAIVDVRQRVDRVGRQVGNHLLHLAAIGDDGLARLLVVQHRREIAGPWLGRNGQRPRCLRWRRWRSVGREGHNGRACERERGDDRLPRERDSSYSTSRWK
ncbi:MAG TPA: hypothetical protein VL654_06375 [Casimicrobiaceae bacterium]|nr:hypothetical protein [Casimicrobiaceae bacterium]